LLAGLVPLVARAQAPDVAQLAAGLNAPQPQQQYAAADALADLGAAAKPAVPALIAALSHQDAELRWRAARALGTIGDAAALDALRKACDDAEATVRAQAIFALGRLKAADEPSLRVIVARLSDKEAQVRRAAVRALRMIEAPRTTTIPLVAKLLEDADATVAMRALHSIAEAGVEVVPALSAALERPEARYWACLALAELGAQAKEAVPGLIKVLDDERPEVRMQAAIALAEIGTAAKPAAGALIKRANDPVLPVAVATVFALGRIADPAAAEVLAKAEQASDPTLKMLATWALAKIHPGDAQREKAAIEMLVKGLSDKDLNVAAMAARALEDLNPDPMKVRPLVDSLTQNNPEVAERVINAFATLGARAVPHAITALKEPARRVRALQVPPERCRRSWSCSRRATPRREPKCCTRWPRLGPARRLPSRPSRLLWTIASPR
jgi:HEAT repeat protein